MYNISYYVLIGIKMVIGIPSNLLGMNIARFYHDSTLTASREVEDQLLSNYDTILKKNRNI